MMSAQFLPDQVIRDHLASRVVGIAGCGGLGSNCAMALARVGVGRLILADFDIVDVTNLNRQYFFLDQVGMPKVAALAHNIGRVDRGITVEIHELTLESHDIPAIFNGCDVIVEAFDKAEMKQMIVETVAGLMPEIPLVCGVGLAGWGSSQELGIRQFGNIYLCGDGCSEVSESFPPLAPRVGIVANMQANTVLEILLGRMQNGNHAQ